MSTARDIRRVDMRSLTPGVAVFFVVTPDATAVLAATLQHRAGNGGCIGHRDFAERRR